MSEAVTSSAGRFPAAPAAADAELLRGARILVVEDEWITAYDVIATLTGAGAVAVGPPQPSPRQSSLRQMRPARRRAARLQAGVTTFFLSYPFSPPAGYRLYFTPVMPRR